MRSVCKTNSVSNAPVNNIISILFSATARHCGLAYINCQTIYLQTPYPSQLDVKTSTLYTFRDKTPIALGISEHIIIARASFPTAATPYVHMRALRARFFMFSSFVYGVVMRV